MPRIGPAIVEEFARTRAEMTARAYQFREMAASPKASAVERARLLSQAGELDAMGARITAMAGAWV